MVARSTDKTFMYQSPADMLRKLKEEIDSLDSIDSFGESQEARHALNGAMTAWHVLDWIAVELSSPFWTEDRASAALGAWLGPDRHGHWKGNLQKIARSQWAMRACEQLANGTKHSVIKRDDSAVAAKQEQWTGAVVIDGEEEEFRTTILYVEIDGEAKSIKELLDAAYKWLLDLLASLGMTSDPLSATVDDEIEGDLADPMFGLTGN